MYPSILNRFPVIQPESPKVRHFSTFFAHFGLPVGTHYRTIAVNVTWIERELMLVKHLAAYTHLSSTISADLAIYRWRVIDFQQSREVNERFLTTFCFHLGTPLGQSR